MLGDVAAGCLGLIFDVIFDIISLGVWEWVWYWFKAVGSIVVFLLTFGRVNLMDKHEALAGVFGLIVHVVIIGLVIHWVITTPIATAAP